MDFASDRQSQARRAYGNPSLSVQVHGLKMESFNVEIRKNGAMKNRSFILGALFGLCSSSILCAAATASPALFQPLLGHAQQSVKALLWTVTAGISISYVATTCFSLERSIYELELKRELWEIENHLAGELQEMIAIYKNQGLSDEEALIVTKIFSKQKHRFANLMMVEELGYSRLDPPTTKEAFTNAGAPAIVGYVLGVMMPLLPIIGNIGEIDSTGLVGIQSNAQVFSGLTLFLGTVLTSCAQTEVFYGAYAQLDTLGKAISANVVGVLSLYGVSFLISKYT